MRRSRQPTNNMALIKAIQRKTSMENKTWVQKKPLTALAELSCSTRWRIENGMHSDANGRQKMPKKVTKISLITVYGFILFYVRVKQISVASGTVTVNAERERAKKSN